MATRKARLATCGDGEFVPQDEPMATCGDGDFVPQDSRLATYEARLATFVVYDWEPRGYAQPESLATYGFYINWVGKSVGAVCFDCWQHYREDDHNDHWVLFHRDDCRFRQAALREDSFAQLIVEQQQQKVREQKRLPETPKTAQDQTALIDDLRQRNQALERQVDALERQKQALEKEVEEKRALENKVEQYASVKTALRTALGL